MDVQIREYSSMAIVGGMLFPTHGIGVKVPGASGFAIKLGAAHIANSPCGQVGSNIGANICLLDGSFCCFCCPASPLLRCSSPSCGFFCCEEVGASVDEQKTPFPRRLSLPFEQPWTAGLTTTACEIPTISESRPILGASDSPLMPKSRAGLPLPDPSRFAMGVMSD